MVQWGVVSGVHAVNVRAVGARGGGCWMTEQGVDSRIVELEQRVQQLTAALVTNRVSATAVGLVMAERRLDRVQAFAWLVGESQRTNTKLAAVALDLVVRAEDSAEDLPRAS